VKGKKGAAPEMAVSEAAESDNGKII